MNKNSDIITALATPYGRSAIAVIRVSGAGSIELVDGLLSRCLEDKKMTVCTFRAGSFTEKLMAVCFRGPRTYTGEDMVELYPHGNMLICDGIIKTLISAGARLAERGEFTKRAFLNGKADLAKCEALADIIDSRTVEQLNYGNMRYRGEFSQLNTVYGLLKKALSTIEAVIHYSDELEENETDEAALDEVRRDIDRCTDILSAEVERFAGGKIRANGFRVALIGAPNVGKSTLLNTLTESDRAIVTDIPGTTRDTVEGTYVYNDRLFTVVDTAGLNENTADEVEKIGIQRAKAAAEAADAVVYVCCEADDMIAENVANAAIRVINKCDGEHDVGSEYTKADDGRGIRLSAKNGININALKQALYDLCPKEFGALSNHRQYYCSVKALDALKAASKEYGSSCGPELVAALLYEACNAIAELFGDTADEEIISQIFQRFCVGK